MRPACANLDLVLAGLVAIAFVHGSRAQEPGPVGGEAGGILNPQPGFLVRAEVNRSTRDYREGDALSVRAAPEQAAFLYVLYQQADGRVFQVFPNRHQPDNHVEARQAVEIPARDDAFRWEIGPPYGREMIKVIAAKRPLAGLADPALRQKAFNPVAAGPLKGVALELGAEPPAEWAEFDVEIHTYPRDRTLESPGARRLGVFFGVSDYEFNAEYELASRGRKGLNLRGCNRDARILAEVLREVGQLSDLRVYIDEHATRRQMEEAVTRWLPAVTRPGDTALIFFSGHGVQIADDNGDEPDGQDEVLAPHDVVTVDIVAQLEKKRTELPGDQRAQLDRYEQLFRGELRRSGSPSKAADALVRQTGISDDLFGRWLQKLDGRRIIVILDNCHSGGFASQEKGDAEALERTLPFDFLDGEITRLKDIGQRETVLLAASEARQPSMSRLEGDHGVMTYCLLDILRKTRGPVEMRRAYDDLRPLMHEYFALKNRARRARDQEPLPEHQPYFISHAASPLYLKP